MGSSYEGLSEQTVGMLSAGLAAVGDSHGHPLSPRGATVQAQVRAVAMVLGQRGLTDARRAELESARRAEQSCGDGPDAGMDLLRDVAFGHRAAAMWAGRLECTVCRAAPGEERGAAWPCPVWVCAVRLGAVSEDSEQSDLAALLAASL